MINMALIGYGYWGPNIARNIYSSKNANLLFICDKSNDRLNKAKKTFVEEVKYTTDYKDLLKSDKIDAVALAVETEASFNIAKDILRAGKHLFIEKPFAGTLSKALELKEIAERYSMTIHVDHILIYHPIIRKIKSIIDSGELGEMIYYDSSRMNLGPIRLDVSAMWDLAVHDLAIIDYLSDGKEPYHIEAIGMKKYGSNETLTYLTLKYEGFISHIKSSWISPLKDRRMIIAGTKKMIVYDDVKLIDKIMIFDSGIEVDFNKNNQEYGIYEYKVRTGDIVVPYINQEDLLLNSLEHFISCIGTGRKSISGPDQAIRVIKILEEADKKLLI